MFSTHIKKEQVDFPGGPGVKNLPAKARYMDLIPCPGRFHMLWAAKPMYPQLLSLSSRPRERQLLSPCALSPCSTMREATAMRSPRTPSRGSPHAAMTTQCNRKLTDYKKWSTYYTLCVKKKKNRHYRNQFPAISHSLPLHLPKVSLSPDFEYHKVLPYF